MIYKECYQEVCVSFASTDVDLKYWPSWTEYIDGLKQDCSIFIADAHEITQSPAMDM